MVDGRNVNEGGGGRGRRREMERKEAALNSFVCRNLTDIASKITE